MPSTEPSNVVLRYLHNIMTGCDMQDDLDLTDLKELLGGTLEPLKNAVRDGIRALEREHANQEV